MDATPPGAAGGKSAARTSGLASPVNAFFWGRSRSATTQGAGAAAGAAASAAAAAGAGPAQAQPATALARQPQGAGAGAGPSTSPAAADIGGAFYNELEVIVLCDRSFNPYEYYRDDKVAWQGVHDAGGTTDDKIRKFLASTKDKETAGFRIKEDSSLLVLGNMRIANKRSYNASDYLG